MAKGELTERQKRFVLEYLSNGGNGTEAAVAAGYSRKSAAAQASRLLNDAKVIAFRQAQARQIYKNLGLSPEKIGLDLYEIFKRCMAAEPHMSWNYETHQLEPDGTYVFDSKGATRALELLGKMEGIFRERVELEGQGIRVEMTLADKEKRLKELLSAGGDD